MGNSGFQQGVQGSSPLSCSLFEECVIVKVLTILNMGWMQERTFEVLKILYTKWNKKNLESEQSSTRDGCKRHIGTHVRTST